MLAPVSRDSWAVITSQAISDAARRLAGVIRPTPAATSEELSGLMGRRVIIKPEHLQRTGSFKIRGAYNRLAALAPGEVSEVIAASAGNHAQGVALASALCGLHATIFMPTGASLPKIEATRGHGATVELVGTSVDEAIEAARAAAAASGALYVPPFDDDLVIAGQATIGVELAEEAPEAEVVVVPVGGGGLISGVAAGLAAAGHRARVIGVEAAGATAMLAALKAGTPSKLATVDTIADGIAVRAVSARTLEHVQALVTTIVTVDDEQISAAMLVLLERCKWVVEPAGAVALAAVMAGAVDGDGPVAVVCSGGNVDPLLLSRLITHGLLAAGRYFIVRVVVPDRPGSLAALTAKLGELGLNLLTVEHQRFGTRAGINEVEVVVTLETRDPAHRDAIVPALEDAGFRAEPYH